MPTNAKIDEPLVQAPLDRVDEPVVDVGWWQHRFHRSGTATLAALMCLVATPIDHIAA